MLDAAARVFYERGYKNATVENVAEALGILKGSLYHYIDSKEEVLFRLLDETHDGVHRILEEVAASSSSEPPLARLHEYVRRQVEFNQENLVRVSVYYRDIDCLSEERLELLLARRRDHERFVGGLIAAAQERGEVDASTDAGALSKCVFATIIWTYRWYSPRRDRDRQIAARCADFAVAGLVGKGPGEPDEKGMNE
jgi:AcrR family transcriptional regulator